jgi:hypothetical protein
MADAISIFEAKNPDSMIDDPKPGEIRQTCCDQKMQNVSVQPQTIFYCRKCQATKVVTGG